MIVVFARDKSTVMVLWVALRGFLYLIYYFKALELYLTKQHGPFNY